MTKEHKIMIGMCAIAVIILYLIGSNIGAPSKPKLKSFNDVPSSIKNSTAPASANKIIWIGCPMISDNYRNGSTNAMVMWTREFQIGLRDDGVVVWQGNSLFQNTNK